jgi:hypothetical protein
VLAVAPAYMGDASLTNEDIEKLFFVFGTSRFATMLLFESRISAYLELALTLAMSAMAVGMLISFASTSIVSFAVAITFFGLATSIFYPVSFTLVTRNTHLVWCWLNRRANSGRICFRRLWLKQPYLAFFIAGAYSQEQLQYLEKVAIVFRNKALVYMQWINGRMTLKTRHRRTVLRHW